MSTRSTIITAVKTCLESILKANGFSQDVRKVLRGIQSEDAFSGNMPGIAVWNEKDTRVDLTRERSESKLLLHIWGYVKVQAESGDYSALDNLEADVRKALMTQAYNAYYLQTYIGNCWYYEGGVEDPIGIFHLQVEIVYDYDHASP